MARQFNLKYINGDWETVQSSAGSTQATATTLNANHNWIATVGDGQGVVLKTMADGDEFTVVNADATETLSVYPPSGASFNGATANLPVVVPANRCLWGKFISATKIAAVF